MQWQDMQNDVILPKNSFEILLIHVSVFLRNWEDSLHALARGMYLNHANQMLHVVKVKVSMRPVSILSYFAE